MSDYKDSTKNINTDNLQFIYNIPKNILFDTSLTINHVRIYSIVRSFMDTTKIAYPSNNWMAKMLNIQRRSVITCLNHLVKKGYLVKEEIKGKRHLRININMSPQEDDDDHGELVIWRSPPSDLEITPPSDLEITLLDQNTITSKDINTTTTLAREKKGGKSSSSVIISKEIDKKLLGLRHKFLQDDDLDRTEEEFLRQCSHHLDNGNKDKYNLARRLKGLSAIISSGWFDVPEGYKQNKVIKSDKSPENVALIHKYMHAKKMEKMGMSISMYISEDEINKARRLLNEK